MRHGRIISINHSVLVNFRNNIRSVIIKAFLKHQLEMSDSIKKIELENKLQHLSLSEEKEIRFLIREQQRLRKYLSNSVCSCGYCHSADRDVIYHEKWGEWWCVECFEREKEELNPENFFNNGLIVVSRATKPCWLLDWCPYGALVEDFLRRMQPNDYSCRVFGHDCPVFYVSEKFTENSTQIPIKDNKLTDSLLNCHFFNSEQIIVFEIEKPCIKLNFCPYGSLNGTFFKRQSNFKFGCNILPHDCPAFFHAQKIREKPYF